MSDIDRRLTSRWRRQLASARLNTAARTSQEEDQTHTVLDNPNAMEISHSRIGSFAAIQGTTAPTRVSTASLSTSVLAEGILQQYSDMISTVSAGNSFFRSWVTDEPDESDIYMDSIVKKWEKKYKTSANSSVKFHLFISSLERKSNLKKKIYSVENDLTQKTMILRDTKKKIMELEADISNKKNELNEIENISDTKLMNMSDETYKKINSIETISSINIYRKEGELPQFLVRTNPLYVKKESWKSERLIGSFLIKFKTDLCIESLKILNITQRMDKYDHPCILDTSPCLGNIREDLTKDIENNDIYEYISDIVAYIQSPNEDHGYLTHPPSEDNPNHDKNGWEWFLEQAKPMPKDFDFDKYDKTLIEAPEALEDPNGINPYTGIAMADGTNIRRSMENHANQLSSTSISSPFSTSGYISITDGVSPTYTRPEPRERLDTLIVNRPDFESKLEMAFTRLARFRSADDLARVLHIAERSISRERFLFIVEIRGGLSMDILISGVNATGEEVRTPLGIGLDTSFSIRESIIQFEYPMWYSR